MKIITSHVVVIASGIVLTLLMALLFVWQPRLLKQIDYKVYDALLTKVSSSQISEMVVIVDIDESSLKQIGQWPWPRYQIARLLKQLYTYNVLSVGIDFIFAEYDRTSLKQIQAEIKQNFTVDLSLDNIPEQQQDNDQLLAEILAKGPVVLAYSFLFDLTEQQQPEQAQELLIKNLHPVKLIHLQEDGVSKQDTVLLQASSAIVNIEPFNSAVAHSGFVNIRPDEDAFIRKAPLLMEFKHQTYPSLSLATLLQAIEPEQIVLKTQIDGSKQLIIEDRIIPLDKEGNLLINYRHTDIANYQTISAYDILSKKVTAAQLAGKIVLIGTSAQGLKDIRATPFNATLPGVYVHAHIIDNIIQGDFIQRPDWANVLELLLLIICGLIVSIILSFFRIQWSIFFILSSGILLWLGSIWLLENAFYVSPLPAIMTIMANFTFLSALKFRQEEKKVMQHMQQLNKIQEGVIHMLKSTKLDLEVESSTLHTKVEDKAKQLNKAFMKVEIADRRIKDSIQYSSRIQKSLLPDLSEINTYLPNSFVLWKPRDTVSGDIFFFTPTSNGLILAVIDCTGHGIPGALLTMIAISSLKKIVVIDGCEDPAEILHQLTFLIKTTLGQDKANPLSDDGLEMSLCFIEKKLNQLTFAGAGLGICYIKNEEMKCIKGDRQKIGYKQSKKADINFQFSNHVLAIKQATSFYMTSDGYVDQAGGVKELPYGTRRYKALLMEVVNFSFDQQKQKLLQAYEQYAKGQKQRDDISVVGFKLEPDKRLG